MKRALIVYGSPGAGKGTQANLLAAKLGLIHFDTGKFMEMTVHDPANANDLVIQEQRDNFDSGRLCDPMWAYSIVAAQTKRIHSSGLGIVFSGSPRTELEAFTAEGGKRGLVDLLEDLYGRGNVHVIYLKIKPETTVYRNSNRMLCSVCGTPVMYLPDAQPKICPLCGGSFRKRTLDTPEIIKVRLQEFEQRTAPILAKLRERGYEIVEIDGEPMPYLVFATILEKLGMAK
ncbi:MAG: nucleoside monophosphate kinase [bacterium]|nr:nucleoside monophosphate kinase [bacterium]